MTGGDGADLFRFDVIENKVDIIEDFDFNEGDNIEIMGETIGDSDKITYNLLSGNISFEGQAVVNIGLQSNLPESINVEPIKFPISEVVARI